MIIARKVDGEETEYPGGNEVQTKGREYLILSKGVVIAQIPRERIDEFAFVPNQPNT